MNSRLLAVWSSCGDSWKRCIGVVYCRRRQRCAAWAKGPLDLAHKQCQHFNRLHASQSAHRRALDVINGVGLGDSLLRMIERRQRLDIWITYGGMAVLTIVAFLVMWFAWFR